MLNRQMVFNDVWSKLFEQGRSSGTYLNCRYRSEDGTKCAVGHLIPNENYTPRIEGKSVWSEKVFSLIDRKYGVVTEVDGAPVSADGRFLREMQESHDIIADLEGYEWRSAFTKGMVRIAERYGLSTEGLPRVDAEVATV